MKLLKELLDLNEGAMKAMLMDFEEAIMAEVADRLESQDFSKDDIAEIMAAAEENKEVMSLIYNAAEAPQDLKNAGTIKKYADKAIDILQKAGAF